MYNLIKKKQLLKVAKESLGKNLAPINKELGCVEALANVFKQATGEELGEDASTYRLYLKLQKDIRFEEIKESEIGCLIISPTGWGNGSIKNGHVGIIGDGVIYSNNSSTLKWDEHYNIITWYKRYVELGGFPMKFFRYIEINKEAIEEERVVLLQKQITLWEKIVRILKELLIKIKK